MGQRLSRRKVYLKVVLLYAVIAVVGLISNTLLASVLVLSAALLLWHYHHLFLLDKWLWRGRKLSPPVGDGIWGNIFEGIYYQRRRERRKRKDLRKVIRRFRDGAEALPDAVVLLTEDWEIVWCNKLAEQLVGLNWPGDEGQRLDNLLRQPDFLDYLDKRKFAKPMELPSPVNPQLTLEFSITPYGIDQHLLIVRDISRLKQLEQIRKDFVANVSHELRTPLTVLQGYLEVLDGEHLPEPEIWQKAHDVMEEQTRRMDALVQQLLALSRMESAAKVAFEAVVNMPLLLQRLEHDAIALNRDKQHAIQFEINPHLNVTGITEELRSACSNLLINAIKYTPAGGTISVSWQLQQQQAVFSVTDNGDGIAAQHIQRLTERFYRVEQARSRATGGSGLGLAIVKHILLRHNSRIQIRSTPGKGSCFSFAIPAQMVRISSNTSLSDKNG